MKTFKKIIAFTLAMAMVAAVSVGATVAYLQDDDSDVNVMTLGNVKIEQHEYEREVNADGTYKKDTIDGKISYVLTDFTQAKPIYPVTEVDANGNPYNHGAGNWDETMVRMSQVNSQGGMQVFENENAVDKFVTVENTGKSDAYVRTLIAYELGSVANFNDVIMTSCFLADDDVWKVTDIGIVEIDGGNYYIEEYLYNGGAHLGGVHENGVLPAGKTTYPSLAQVYMKATATNEDVEAIDGNDNGAYDILVLSQAVQTNGFENAQTALDTAFGKASEKAAEWFAEVADYHFVEADGKKDQILGEELEEVLAALQNGTDLIVDREVDLLGFDTNDVDAKDATVTLVGQGADAYGYLAFLPEAGEPVKVSNLNVTGSGFVEVGHYGEGGGDYTVNNLKIENLESTLANGDKGFTLACGFCHYGNAVLNECVMTGTTAIQDGAMAVDAGFVNDTTTVVNDGEYGTVYCWSHAIVTIDGAEVENLYVAPIKGTVTIKADTHIETLNVAYGTSDTNVTKARLEKLVIEDGATVDNIVFRGTTYTVAGWNAFVAAF